MPCTRQSILPKTVLSIQSGISIATFGGLIYECRLRSESQLHGLLLLFIRTVLNIHLTEKVLYFSLIAQGIGNSGLPTRKEEIYTRSHTLKGRLQAAHNGHRTGKRSPSIFERKESRMYLFSM